MVGIVANGRAAWIGGIVLGLVLLIVGLATGPNTWLASVGGGFLLLGLVLLIISVATKGRSD